MTVVCLLCLCLRPGRVSTLLSCRLSWRPGCSRRFWFCRAGSYASVSAFSTSMRRGSADLRYHASRLRSTLDSAWKAATRLKAEETSSTPAAPPTTLAETATEIQEEKVRRVTGTAPPTTQQAPPSAIVAIATEIQEWKECKVTGTAPPTKQVTPLFHPGSLSVYLGETYDYLSQHINSYFSSLTKPGSDVAQPTSSRPETSVSVGKGLGSYLSSSPPRVQGFIGSYITPLVPWFRTEPRDAYGWRQM